jgi:hypothetical protein
MLAKTHLRESCAATRLRLKQLDAPSLSRKILSHSKILKRRHLTLLKNYIGMPEDIGIHIAGIAHQLNNADSDFDPKDGFHRSVVLVLCSIIVSALLCY